MTAAPVPSDAASARIIRDAATTRALVTRLRRRSLVVRFWRGALPTLIGAGLVILVVWAVIGAVANLVPTGRESGEIRMVNPEFLGHSKAGQPYKVTAQSAVRDSNHPDRTALTEPRLVMQTLNRGELRVSANAGQYSETSRVMNLQGGVKADDAMGYHFESPTARVDTGASQAEGHDGVVSTGPLGRVTAANYWFDDKAGHVVLRGHVQTHLAGRKAP